MLSAPAAEVTRYLSAADAAVALIRPCFSKRSSSPTKYAEALAVGLPLLISREVGDGADIEEREGAVAMGYPIDAAAMEDAARRLARLMEKPRAHFRALAREMFDVDTVALPAYRRLYERICSPVRVACVVPYPPGSAPSQRFRLEQWEKPLAAAGVTLEFFPFMDPEASRQLYEKGRLWSKARSVAGGTLRRLRWALGQARDFDVVVIHRRRCRWGSRGSRRSSPGACPPSSTSTTPSGCPTSAPPTGASRP